MVIKVILAIFISLMISFCISLWRRRTMRKKLYEAASIISGPTFFSAYNHIANDMRGFDFSHFLSEQIHSAQCILGRNDTSQEKLLTVYLDLICFYAWHSMGNKDKPKRAKLHDLRYTIFEDPGLLELFYQNYVNNFYVIKNYNPQVGELKNINEIKKELQQIIYSE